MDTFYLYRSTELKQYTVTLWVGLITRWTRRAVTAGSR